MGVVIGIVGNCPHHCKGHLVDVADLSDAAALHLTGHRAEFLHQPVQLVLLAYKLISSGDNSLVTGQPLYRSRGRAHLIVQFLVARDLNPIDSGNKPFGIP